jgi:hypothetical protein
MGVKVFRKGKKCLVTYFIGDWSICTRLTRPGRRMAIGEKKLDNMRRMSAKREALNARHPAGN